MKVKKVWMYLSRTVDSRGNTLAFLLSPTRDAQAAKCFFAKALGACYTVIPRVCHHGRQILLGKAGRGQVSLSTGREDESKRVAQTEQPSSDVPARASMSQLSPKPAKTHIGERCTGRASVGEARAASPRKASGCSFSEEIDR